MNTRVRITIFFLVVNTSNGIPEWFRTEMTLKYEIARRVSFNGVGKLGIGIEGVECFEKKIKRIKYRHNRKMKRNSNKVDQKQKNVTCHDWIRNSLL